MREYYIYKSKKKALLLIALCSLFVVPSIFMLYDTTLESKFWPIASIVFFGLGYPAGLFNLLDRRPLIIINEIGIYDRMGTQNFVNWEIIYDAYIQQNGRQKFISLVIDERYEPSKNKGKMYQTMAAFSKELGFQELNIAVSFADVKDERLLSFIMAMIKADRSDRERVIVEELTV